MYPCLQHRWHPDALETARLLVTEGLSNKEIANRFGTDPQAVKEHLRNLFRHARARNRAHFVALCLGTATKDGGE